MIMITPRALNEHDRLRMSRGVAAALFLTLLAGNASSTGAAPRYPRNALVLFVAPWCAPCYGELARLDDIAAAARPRQVRVLLVEEGARASAMVRTVEASRRWALPAREMRRVRADVWLRTGGLPYSVATDDEGRICAEQKGGLDPARTRQLVERCR